MDYWDAIRSSAGLMDTYALENNPEYLRGMCELIVSMFPLPPEIDYDFHKDLVKRDIAIVVRASSVSAQPDPTDWTDVETFNGLFDAWIDRAEGKRPRSDEGERGS